MTHRADCRCPWCLSGFRGHDLPESVVQTEPIDRLAMNRELELLVDEEHRCVLVVNAQDVEDEERSP